MKLKYLSLHRFKIYKNGDIIYTENKGDRADVEEQLRKWLLPDQPQVQCQLFYIIFIVSIWFHVNIIFQENVKYNLSGDSIQADTTVALSPVGI
jgi:hypothetical protein